MLDDRNVLVGRFTNMLDDRDVLLGREANMGQSRFHT